MIIWKQKIVNVVKSLKKCVVSVCCFFRWGSFSHWEASPAGVHCRLCENFVRRRNYHLSLFCKLSFFPFLFTCDIVFLRTHVYCSWRRAINFPAARNESCVLFWFNVDLHKVLLFSLRYISCICRIFPFVSKRHLMKPETSKQFVEKYFFTILFNIF